MERGLLDPDKIKGKVPMMMAQLAPSIKKHQNYNGNDPGNYDIKLYQEINE